MKPGRLKTKIFLDSGDPQETREALRLLRFLDGQTTNPSLISRNPETAGKKFTKAELLEFYKGVVQEISRLIPRGSVSIEVYADKGTSAQDMLKQGREMFSWIPNAHIKFPTTKEGLRAAHQAIQGGIRVNMTLVFSQQQAAAVYAATKGARRGDVFVSPFVGRLDERGENGMSLIENILKMYKTGDGHVEVLTASVRSVNHLLAAIHLRSSIVTCPLRILREWTEKGLETPSDDFAYCAETLKRIPYEEIDLRGDWPAFDISHALTDIGLEQFSADWKSLYV